VLRLREKVVESFEFSGLHRRHFDVDAAEGKNRFGLEVAA